MQSEDYDTSTNSNQLLYLKDDVCHESIGFVSYQACMVGFLWEESIRQQQKMIPTTRGEG